LRRILIANLPALYEKLANMGDLYIPTQQEDITNFEKYEKDAKVDLHTLKTANTPKSIFLPQAENLFSAVTTDGKISINPVPLTALPFCVFGVRACDEAALAVLDSVYLNEPIDQFYAARRNAGCIITLACKTPKPSCFCAAFGIDAANPTGDVATWLEGSYLYWKGLTDKGVEITKTLTNLLEDTEDKPFDEQTTKQIYGNLPLDKFNDADMMKIFNLPDWDKLHDTCIACGTCAFVCPTCQCYDIRDFDNGTDVTRYRCWDSCMYSDFTLMTHGNSRQTQKERFRQRFMHKLVYHPQNNNGQFGCTGCGRCVSKCPAGLNILKIIKDLGVAADV